MRSLAYVIACGALLAGTSAHAVSLDIAGKLSGNVALGSQSLPWANGMIADFGENGEGPGFGGATETKVKVTSSYASFESGVAVSGPAASAQSNSGLNVKIINTGEEPISLNSVGSTIIPAGLGFYMQDRTSGDPKGGNIFTGFGQDGGSSFASLFTEELAGTTFATSGFTFDIYGDDYIYGENSVNEEASPLYTLSGELTLSFDEFGNVVVGGSVNASDYYSDNFEDVSLFLDGFETEFNNDFALAYKWGQTDIDVILNQIMAGGHSTNLYYRTTAYANTTVGCVGDSLSCIVAYSGFGDPIGRGGGVSLAAARGFGTQSLDTIDFLKFDPQLIDPFRPNTSAVDPGGAVPEPSTWTMVIMGFGLLGAALRRRRVLSYS